MKLPMKRIGGPLLLSDAERASNADRQRELSLSVREKREVVRRGWGTERVHKKGKLTSWERIERLIDPGTETFPVGTLVNWGRDFPGSKRQAPGAGVVVGPAPGAGNR